MTQTLCNINFPAFLSLWNKMHNQSTPDIHLKLALWLERAWLEHDRRLLVMAFRAFGKSTIVGIFCTWLLWRNPDLRILVLAADLALARKMVRQVKRIIEKHPLTRDLKPARVDQWADERFTLKRKLELRDPSMLAKGITTNLTGTRADFIICDDVEVPKTCDTAGKRENLRERLNELDYILTPDGTMMYVGTPHHWNTIYADKARPGEDRIFLEGFARIVVPVMDVHGASAWPERFTREKIDSILFRTGPSQFSSQMLCVPVNLSDGRFDPKDLEVYNDDIVYTESQREPVLYIGERKMVSAAAYWDPAFGREQGDKSIIAIVYICETGEYWLHHIQMIRVEPNSSISVAHQQAEKAIEICEQYFIPQLAIETNGLGQLFPGILKTMMSERGVPCAVTEIVNRTPKNIRIQEALEVALANRSLHVHKTVLPNSFLRELQDWNPNKRNQADDALDAVAGAIKMQPVRIARSYNKNRHSWQLSSKVRFAKTEFNV